MAKKISTRQRNLKRRYLNGIKQAKRAKKEMERAMFRAFTSTGIYNLDDLHKKFISRKDIQDNYIPKDKVNKDYVLKTVLDEDDYISRDKANDTVARIKSKYQGIIDNLRQELKQAQTNSHSDVDKKNFIDNYSDN